MRSSRFLSIVKLATILGLASVGYRFLHEEFVVDHCLSGLHGSFDYSTMSCDVKENHVYVPYHVRHPYDAAIFIVALGMMVAIRLGYRPISAKSEQ
jgi:hypothetical protein